MKALKTVEQNLAKQNHSDVSIFANGECFISQSAISRATGIPQQTLSRWIISDNGLEYNTNKFNQLDPESMQKIVIMGSRKYNQCFEFMTTLIQAGAKAYIFNLAGVALGVTPKIPTSRKGLLELALAQETELEALRIKVLKQLPDVIFSEHLDGTISMNALAKVISCNTPVTIGANKLFALLRGRDILLGGRSIKERNLPAQKFVKHFPVTLYRSEFGTSYTTSVSELGVEYVTARIQTWLESPKPVALPVPPKPVAPPATIPKLVMISEPKDVQLWLDIGWTEDSLFESGRARWDYS